MIEIIGEHSNVYINEFRISIWIEEPIKHSGTISLYREAKIEYFYNGKKKHEVLHTYNDDHVLIYLSILANYLKGIAEYYVPSIHDLRKGKIDELL